MGIEFGKERHVVRMEKLKPIIAEIKKQKDILSKAQNDLRDIENTLCAISNIESALRYKIDTFDLAIEDLQKTINLLSEYV